LGLSSPRWKETDLAQRIDKWLVYARFVKHRARAAALIEQGAVRINKIKVEKLSQAVKPGDVLTLALGPDVQVVKVLAEPERRGPAADNATLFEVLNEAR
jgi:ribosome-associated heat shock protein Hsp15